jgi:chromosome segregation ATPase
MRKLLIPAILIGAAVAAPASAQYQGRGYGHGYGYGQGQDIHRQLQQLDQRIERAFQRGAITRNEARELSNDLRRIENRFRDYRRNGLSPREHQDLQYRIRELREDIREDRRDGRDWDDRRDRRGRW